MTYVDIYAAAVPTEKKDAFVAFSDELSGLFKEHGAIGYVECWGTDVPDGELTSFPMAVKKRDDETVVIGWVNWPSKKKRDEAWPKLMEDPRMQSGEMPFDGKRMIFGTFEMVVDA